MLTPQRGGQAVCQRATLKHELQTAPENDAPSENLDS